MSGRHSESYTESGFEGSLRGSSWQERKHKRDEDHRYEQEEDHSGPGEGSLHTYRSMSNASRHERFDRRNEELERLRRLVRDLELEARGRHRRRDREKHAKGSASVGGSYGEASINIGIGLESMQIETRFPQRGDDHEMLPWML